MGEPKQLLPWNGHTVIEQVVESLTTAGASPILVIVGHVIEPIRKLLQNRYAQIIVNPDYQVTEMLRSYQIGLETLMQDTYRESLRGTLLSLSDQPHISSNVIRRIIEQAQETPSKLVIPSYNMRRGHPLHLPRKVWSEVIALETTGLRDVVNRYTDDIVYVNTETDAVLRDMDTPADYASLAQSTR